MTASGHDQSPRNSLRGSTRGTGDWHVYTAVFDQRKSEMYVDGYCEASGKNVGANTLDGLSIGCDHTGIFFLTGMVAELRLYHCHMPTAQRVQTEAALARRYSLSYSWMIGRELSDPYFATAPERYAPWDRARVVVLVRGRRQAAAC